MRVRVRVCVCVSPGAGAFFGAGAATTMAANMGQQFGGNVDYNSPAASAVFGGMTHEIGNHHEPA